MNLWILLSFLGAITTSSRIVAYKYLSNTNYDNITINNIKFLIKESVERFHQ